MRVIVKEAGRARCPRPLDTAGEEPAEGHGPRSAPGTPWSAGEAAGTRKSPRAIVENGPCASRSSQRARALGEMTAPTPCC